MEIVFALITTITYGLDTYFVRKGLLETPFPLVAAFITLTINLSIFIGLYKGNSLGLRRDGPADRHPATTE